MLKFLLKQLLAGLHVIFATAGWTFQTCSFLWATAMMLWSHDPVMLKSACGILLVQVFMLGAEYITLRKKVRYQVLDAGEWLAIDAAKALCYSEHQRHLNLEEHATDLKDFSGMMRISRERCQCGAFDKK